MHVARRAQFGIGWLAPSCRAGSRPPSRRAASATAGRSTGWSGATPAYSVQGPLTALVTVLGTEADRRRAARDADARLVAWLTSLGAERGLDWSLAAVHPEVTISAGALSGTVSGQQFLSPVLGPAHYLDPQGFSATGSAAQSNEVDRTALATVGVPVPGDSFVELPVRPGSGQQSMDRFVARLDITRQLMLDHVAHFGDEDIVRGPPGAARRPPARDTGTTNSRRWCEPLVWDLLSLTGDLGLLMWLATALFWGAAGAAPRLLAGPAALAGRSWAPRCRSWAPSSNCVGAGLRGRAGSLQRPRVRPRPAWAGPAVRAAVVAARGPGAAGLVVITGLRDTEAGFRRRTSG